MRPGKYFRIPETLDDVDRLRKEALPVEESTCPEWLASEDEAFYLYLGSTKALHLSEIEKKLLHSEIEELHSAGLIVSEDNREPGKWRIYVTSAPLYEEWSIGIYSGESLLNLQDPLHIENPVISHHDILDVQAVFVADPFMIQYENRWFMFFEVLNWRANKGEIGLATSHDGVSWNYEAIVLVEPFHLSYPYVFRFDGNFYMLPEAKQSGAVRLYQAFEFPHDWRLVGTFLEGEDLVDTSIFSAYGVWWLLAAGRDSQGSDVLRLFMSDTLLGTWHEHCRSPFDDRGFNHVRPAGRVIVCEQKLFRFAQNNQGSYGTSVSAFEITQLNANSYDESPLKCDPILGPTGQGWAAAGMHHIDAHNCSDGTWLACVDGRQ